MLFVALPARAGHVEVEHEEFRLLGAVAGADRANEFGGGGADTPHYAAGTAGAELYQVAYELARAYVPQLHRAVVRGRDHEAVARLQTGHRRLVLVWPCGRGENVTLFGRAQLVQRSATIINARHNNQC